MTPAEQGQNLGNEVWKELESLRVDKRALVEAIEAHRASRHGDSPILRRVDPWDEKLYAALDQSGKP